MDKILQTPDAPPVNRTVRVVDVEASAVATVADGIDDLYDDKLDVIVVRHALARAPLAAAGERLVRDDWNPGWARPNETMPVEDIQILGTDTPATPTYKAPRGASLEAYLESATKHRAATATVFAAGFDATAEFQRVLGQLAGKRPVEVAVAADGRQYTPFTIRKLGEGKQIGLHHDYHYPLALYRELGARLDTRTLISFVVTLGRPSAGGELVVYGVTPETPDPPKMPNGFSWDLDAVERRFHFERFQVDVGDLFIVASGRCLHRVSPVVGSRPRVTMGGFLALEKQQQRVLFWS